MQSRSQERPLTRDSKYARNAKRDAAVRPKVTIPTRAPDSVTPNGSKWWKWDELSLQMQSVDEVFTVWRVAMKNGDTCVVALDDEGQVFSCPSDAAAKYTVQAIVAVEKSCLRRDEEFEE